MIKRGVRARKKGQLKISFGMIFSIILIIVFLAFAFYAIQKFLDTQNEIKIQKFYSELDDDIKAVWASTEASENVEYSVPGRITQVCFDSRYEKNVYLRDDGLVEGRHIDHIDLSGGKFCYPVSNGKVKLTLEKNFEEALVTIKEQE